MHISRATAGRRGRAAVVAAVVACSVTLSGPDFAAAGGGPTPDVPVPELDWQPCVAGSPFDCATAEVPLDHSNPTGRTIELAVVKREATDPGRRIGTLFFNPGGPGGPGTVQMPQNYEAFPHEVRERFDIVSWDPRGIGNSTAVNCFGSPEEAAAWEETKAAGFPVGAKERTAWTAAYEELARNCEKRDAELLRHVSTADTARDLDLLRRAVGDEQLTYRGNSYGTYLGATYANLFPGKVRAMVLDSDWNPSAWTNNGSADAARSTSFTRLGSDVSAAGVLDQFLTRCGSTTTAHCAFSAGSPEATRAKYDRLMERLRDRPIGPWTYARTVSAMVSGFYVVHPGWTEVARVLQELSQGREPQPSAFPPPPPVKNPNPYTGEEQSTAVLCGDSPNPRDPGVYHDLEEESAARAGDVGRHWIWATFGCTAWPATAADSYRGPWDTPTAHPLLVIGVTHDPSTPHQAAEAMVEHLADARLLTVEGNGHTTLLNPSGCADAYESRYLVDGVLPPAGTTCRQDTPPFADPRPSGGVATGGGGTADGGARTS
ncbi:alpha/beta hydrolase [Streptomyces sp. SID7958]|uniref:Alpha/beta hydrolase n=2 Tax=unclassified Streptomyces TaxID=2593676 RepID=A0A6G3QX73_9ACTN|nr:MULTISPECIES: alpha/beta hydrolase [unclassified Streptomyces]NEA87971.1 alpha/beta hydrolase [Streptomyces sp. SID14436]NEC83013.1 alpha/beta hydrolase [Streptomyces sp. SID7958]